MKKIISLFSLILGFALLLVLASCEPKLYTVKFDLNGGSPQIADKTFRIGDRIEEVENPTREGHTFDGWWIDSNFTTKFQFNQKVGKDMTIYAKWKINSYTINYFSNGGTEIEPVRYEYNADISAPTAPTKEGYIFDDWYTDATFQEVFVFDKMPARNLKLYAKWNPEEYEIRFLRTKGGELYENLTQLVPNQERVEKPANPTRVGFTFDNWYKEENDEVYDFTKIVNKPLILYAKWIINQYTVSYVTGEGASTLESDTYDFNAALNRPTNPTKEGYRFAGWTLNGADFVFDDKKMPANDIELVAKWTPNEYTISFNKNSNKVTSGSIEAINMIYDEDVIIPNHNYVIEGYTFAGWNSKSDGTGTSYVVGESYSNLTSIHLGTFELFAIWAANQYTINFDKGLGVGEMASITASYDQTVALPANTFTKEGYHFNGWNLDGVIYADKDSITNLVTEGSVTLVARWLANQYQVKFNAEGGQTKNQSFTYDEPKALTTNTFTKVGYTFAGWATEVGGAKVYSNQQEVNNLTTVNNGTFNLYAVWTANTYTVNFNANGGDGEMLSQSFTYDASKALSLNNFTKEGYLFANWKLNNDTYNDGEEVKNLAPSGSVTLVAEWTPITYQIVFDNNGGAGVMTAESFTYDVEKSLPLNIFTKEGYTFNGWNFDGSVYQDEALVKNLTNENNKNLTFVANWKANAYQVTFNGNSGLGSMTDQLFIYDVPQALKANAFTKTGYTFAGWATSPTGNKEYNNQQQVSNLTSVNNGTVNLYAVWVANEYSVKFNSNGGVGTMADQPFTYNVTKALTLNLFTKEGYTFVGWSTEIGGAKVYVDGQEVSNLTSVHNGIYNLYAVWTANTYTVSFDANGGTGEMLPQSFTYDVTQALTLNSFTKEGYLFANWKLNTTTYIDGEEVSNLAPSGSVTLVAEWTPISYKVAFNSNGGTGTMAAQSFTYDTGQTLTLNNFTKEGYSFAGWATEVGGNKVYNNGQEVINLANVNNATFNLYAVWTPNTYTVSFNANGGQNEMLPQSFTYGIAQALTANGFAKTGYRFTGWATELNGAHVYDDKQSVSNLTSAVNGEVELFAIWAPIAYSIVFNANGGSGTMTAQPFTYDATQALKDNGFAKEGYTFAGWATSPTGNKEYNNQQQVSNLTSVHNGTFNLYAFWTANQYMVNFNANGGDGGTMSSQSFTYNTPQHLTLNAFTRTGYNFAGWRLNTTTYADGEEVSNLATSGSVTLIAQWTPITYTVSFDANGGSGTMTVQSFTYDVAQALSENLFTKEGYSFNGWTHNLTSYNDKQVVNNLTTTDNANLTFVAKWQINSYKLTIKYNDGVSADKEVWYEFDAAINPETPKTVEGKVFAGWKDVQTGLAFVFEGAKMPARHLTIIATFVDEIYITFDSKGGSPVDTISGTAGSPVSAPAEPTKEGHTFINWFIPGEVDPYVFTVMPSADVNLEARWTVNKYTVTYETNGGNVIAAEDLDFDSTITQVPVKAGYTFKGWFNQELSTPILKVPASAVTVYAKWQANQYMVNFSANGGSGTMSAQLFIYDTPQHLTLNLFTRTGYNFAGWKLNATTYGDGEEVNNLATSGSVTLVAQWTPITYTVSFNASGGENTMTPQSFTYGVTQPLTANAFAKTGYRFDGWATSPGGTHVYNDKQEVSDLTSVDGGEVKLYAIWVPNTYSVVFNANGGQNEMTPQSFTYGVAQSLKANTFTKTGYTFAGWAISPTGNKEYNNQQQVSNLTSVHNGTYNLYAVWTPNTYTVNFDANSGDGTMTPQSFTYDVAQALTANGFAKTGYNFAGWKLNTTTYADKEEVINLATSGSVTLVAQWTPITYSVVFNINGGNGGTMSAQSFTYNVAQALTANGFSKTGYSFTGWATSPTGDKVYNNQQQVSNLTSVHNGTYNLYAKWQANTYTVNFSANGGSGSMSPQLFTYDTPQHLTLNLFTRTGYNFAGWKLNATTYGDGEEVNNLATSGSVTLVAQWTPITYTVSFNASGGENTMSPQSFTYGVTQALTANAFAKTGYRFTGWAISPGGTHVYDDKQEVSDLTSVDGGEVKLYAIWAANIYSVVFNINGGNGGTMSAQSFTYGVAQALTANGFSKTGYSFIGWATSPTGDKVYNNQQQVSNLTSVHNGTYNLYAKWQANQYIVNFSANGGDGGTMSPQSFTYDTPQKLTLNAFTRTGYNFAGWKLNSTTYTDEEEVNNLATSGSVTLVAQWTPITYTVSFNGSGGENTMSPQSFTYGVTQALTENAFTKTGYKFTGWATSPGGAHVYDDKEEVSDLTSVDGGEVKLYAIWAPITYGIAFDGNGHTSGSTTGHTGVNYNTSVTLNLNNFNKTGYAFAGWATTPSGAVAHSNGASVSNLTTVDGATVTLYAKWTPITYTVIFNGNGSTSGTMDNFTATYDVVHPFPTNNYVRNGHTFIGWSTTTTSSGLIDNIYNLASTQGATFTINALWQIHEYDIRFEFEFGRDPIHFSGVVWNTQLSTLELPNLDLVGHQFIGWKLNGVIVDLATIYASSDMTFVASYEAKQYNVSFLIDGVPTYSLTNQTYGTVISFDNYVDVILFGDYQFVNGVYNELQDFMSGTNQAPLNATLNNPEKMATWQAVAPVSYPYATALKTAIAGGNPTTISEAATALNNVLNSEHNDIQNRYLIYHNNDNKPIKEGYVFIGWVLGESTQYGNDVEGDAFTGYSPAALIAGETANIVAKWTSLQTINDDDIIEDGGNPNKINWVAANTTLIQSGLKPGETLELRYELYNIISSTERFLIDGNITTNSYTFLTSTTWSVPGTYYLKVVSRATIKNAQGDVVKVFKSSFADTPFVYVLQISGTNLEVTGQGDYYFKGNDPAYPDGETFYFYTNLTYNFLPTESFTLVLANGDPAPAGTYDAYVSLGSNGGGTNNQFVTQGTAGNFYFKRSTDNKVYFTRVLPFVASFHFGEKLENYVSNKDNANNPIFRGISKDPTYKAALTYKIGKKNELMTQANGLADYDENGFKFDLTVRTSGGNTIDPYVYDDYFVYSFYKYVDGVAQAIETSEIVDGQISTSGVIKFKSTAAEDVKYKVQIKIKDTYVAPKLRANIVPLELDFTLNKGANVFTHNVLRKVYATTTLKDGINLHANIVASLAPEQRYTPEAVAAGNPFLKYATDEALRSGNEDDFPGGSAVNVSFSKIILEANINKAYLTGNVYIRASLTDLQEEYHINGNLFTIDATNLTRSSIRSIGNLSKLVDTYKIVNQQAAIFAYVSTNLETKYSQSTLNVNDLMIKGNTTNSKLDSSSQAELQNSIELMNRNSGGHVAVQAVYGSNVNITNTAIINSTIALTMNGGYGKAVLKTVYTQSCWANSLYLHNGGELELINTLLKDSGGAAIHAEDVYSTPTVPSPHKVTIDDLSEIDNFVSGEEGYFKAYAMEFTVMTMKSQMEMAVNPQGMTVIKLVTDPITGLQTEKVNFKFLFVPAGANAQPSGRQEAVTKYYVSEPGTIPGSGGIPYPSYYDIYVVKSYNPSGMALILPVNEIIILRKDNIPGYGPSLIGVGIYPITP